MGGVRLLARGRIEGDDLVFLVHTDLAGVTRARAVPIADLPGRLRCGVGWVPANLGLSAFGLLVPNPWGPLGDLRLLPDPQTEARVDLWDDATPLHFFQCDIVETDGRIWHACPRGFLKTALADLEAETGLQLRSAFEHEFHLSGMEEHSGNSFSLERFRLAEAFGAKAMAGLRQAHAEPEVFMTEYGPAQFEVSCRPASGVAGADRAVVIREVVREVARRQGRHASFSPLVTPQVVGNGVHIHFSLDDGEGRPVLHDDARPGQLSAIGGSFAAGVLRHLPALCALTAPSVISAARLVPHRWSAGFTTLGVQNREAAVRICPAVGLLEDAAARQFHLEYRAADAAACPHLCLGAIVRAGLAGIRDKLPAPPVFERDPMEVAADERERLGARRLPETLEAALEALEADGEVPSWFPEDMWQCYLAHKRYEIEQLEGLDLDEQCARYRTVY
jgi:glutamine synthetase